MSQSLLVVSHTLVKDLLASLQNGFLLSSKIDGQLIRLWIGKDEHEQNDIFSP